jgi:4-aminobutyrate aminotransferase
MEVYPHLTGSVPGPRGRAIIDREDAALATSTKFLPLVVKSGRGPLIEDEDGNVFLDFACGVCVTNLGHAHPRVVAAVRDQAGKFLYSAGTDFYYDVQARLASRLAALVPGPGPKKVFFANSGSESVEAAIKLAKKRTGRHQFIGFIGAFHGRTLGANSFMACKTVQREGYFPMMGGVLQIPYAYCYRCAYHETYPACGVWCAKILEEIYFKQIVAPEEIAAVLVEPIQGEAGYIVPPDAFLRELRRICDEHGILFIADEVQTGLGRTGRMFAVEYPGVAPDVLTVAKGIASGLPMGATVFKAEHDFPVKGSHSNTFGGNPVCCAASLATLDVIEEDNLAAKAAADGEYVRARMEAWRKIYDFVGDVRGRGMFTAFELVTDSASKTPAPALADELVEKCFRKGLVLIPCGFSAIRVIPPINIDRPLLDKGLGIIEETLKDIAAGWNKHRGGA